MTYTHGITTRALLVALILVIVTGCKEPDAEAVLLAGAGPNPDGLVSSKSSFQVDAIKNGQADWVPFRELSAQGKHDSEAPEAPAVSGTTEVEAEIRTIISDYNDIAADGDVDTLLDYYVEDQVDVARAKIENGFLLLKKIDELGQVLREAIPDDSAKIDGVLADARNLAQVKLEPNTLEIIGETEVVAHANEGDEPSDYRFVLTDGDWYISLDNPRTVDAAKAVYQESLSALDAALAGLQSGAVSADQVLDALEQQVRAAKPNTGSEAAGAVLG